MQLPPLFVPRARTAMAKTRAFAFIGPALWNQLPRLTRSSLLTGGLYIRGLLSLSNRQVLFWSFAMGAPLIDEHCSERRFTNVMLYHIAIVASPRLIGYMHK